MPTQRAYRRLDEPRPPRARRGWRHAVALPVAARLGDFGGIQQSWENE